MAKKAQIEVQFNWIFVLIVGAIILTFFVVIVTRQRGAAEQVLSRDILNEIETLISGVAVSEGKTFLIELPDVPVVYNCDETCSGAVTIQGSGLQGVAIKEKSVFSPDTLRGQKVVMWSQEFNVPFRATNFFYMTSPQARYLIEKTDFGEFIHDELPPKIIIEEGIAQPAFTKDLFESVNDIQDLNNYKVKLVFFDTDPELPSSLVNMLDEDVSAIKVDEPTNDITFYQKNVNSFALIGNTKYIERSSLFGAVFAENLETYECMMENAFKNLDVVSQVYAERSLNLQIVYDADPTCKAYYDTLYIDEISNVANKGFKGMTSSDFIALQDSLRGLSSQNQFALAFSCAPVY